VGPIREGRTIFLSLDFAPCFDSELEVRIGTYGVFSAVLIIID